VPDGHSGRLVDLAYGDRGVPGVIPLSAELTAEITILDHPAPTA